jgi:hypothetical protein
LYDQRKASGRMNCRKWSGHITLQCQERRVSHLYAYCLAPKQWHQKKSRMRAWECRRQKTSKKLTWR